MKKARNSKYAMTNKQVHHFTIFKVNVFFPWGVKVTKYFLWLKFVAYEFLMNVLIFPTIKSSLFS